MAHRIRILLFLLLAIGYGFGKGGFGESSEIPAFSGEQDERDLSSELQEIGSWSQWSEWSSCSRSCDGGVAQQRRTCRSGSCNGNSVRYKICNMQPCPDSRDFREEQCEAFNDVPHEGALYEWSAHYEDESPCALTCKGKPISQDEDVFVVAKLANRVHDGTRCRFGSLDMCIEGECQTVGCDLRIGSGKQIDACGVCGGDGSSCAMPLYHWTLESTSLCSATCGGGYRMSRALCQNRVSGEEVAEELCNDSQKPDTTVVECNTHNCPPKWHASDWSECSVTCGGGSKLRQVYCIEETNNTKLIVPDDRCEGRKPWNQEACNPVDCPRWIPSPWSGCSVSCGEGVQVRMVECRDSKDQISRLCEESSKPLLRKPCSTGIHCPFHIEEDGSDELLPGLYHTQPLVQHFPPPPNAQRLVDDREDREEEHESSFHVEEWGPCSVTCGEGTRTREVHCKILLKFSKTIAKLPDKNCDGPKPPEIEKCFREPCSERIGVDIKDDPYRPDIKVGGANSGKSYSWKEQGFTHCSATCLGGVQESIVNCVRDDTQKVTSPYMCPIELKPETVLRTCNDHACPPRWNYSEFSPCSQSCGIGIQTREVTCIHEVTQGGGNTVTVPNNMCPQPPPPDRQYCNVLDCPVRWKVHEWSRCSKSCGGGEKVRQIECKQVMAQNHTVDRPAAMCPQPKPLESKPCNTKSCIIESDKPQIDVSNSTFIQHDPKKKKISLKVGGAATVFLGTTIKIKCPVKRFNRTKIQWAKDKNYLPKNKKFKTSKKGALRVQNLTLRDSGLYTCIAGKSTAGIQISVRPKPGEFPTSEEIQRQGFKTDRVDLISDHQANRDEPNPIYSDDHSHEQRPDMKRKKPSAKPKLTTTTLPSLRLDSSVNSLNSWHTPTSTSSKLWPFQKSSSSRGHRNLPDYSQDLHDFTSNPFYPNIIQEVDDENEMDVQVNLGKGSRENLKFEWILSNWSKCSDGCGEGFQTRGATCIVRLHNTTEEVSDALCEDAGLPVPQRTRKCSGEFCAKWISGPWSSCDASKCFALHRALQRRSVKCKLGNVTVNQNKCDLDQKPIHKQECENLKCVGKWKVSPWSDCTAACEMEGLKHRILQCVWFGTKKAAGTACKDIPRPPVMKSCKGPPCSTSGEDCKDHSMFCRNVKAMNMCKILRYQQQCCRTCKA